MQFRGKHHNSPNHVLLAAAIALVVASVLCARSLWIPASRIGNLHARAVVLSTTEAIAAYAATTGLDTAVPSFRTSFLELTGLSGHSSWDSRYFNRRDSTCSTEESVVSDEDSPAFANSQNIPVDDETAVPVVMQSPEQPVSVEERPVRSRIYSRENPLGVYFFGDSQVFSLASGLSRLAGKDSAIDVDFLAIHSSGFIRDDFYDWPHKLEDTLAEKEYAAVVVMLGMNDYQNFWTGDRRALKKRTGEWERVYREKCRIIIDTALARAMRVYWVGMPRVKNPSYDDNLSYIESLHDSVAQEYSPDVLVRISLREVIPGDGNPYTDTVELAPGRVQRIMTEDGSHFTVEGGQLVMCNLFDRLVRDFPFSELPVAQLPE